MAGRGRASTGELLEVAVDYAYQSWDQRVRKSPCWWSDKKAGCLGATQVPSKGVEPYSQAFLVGWLRGLGYKRLVMRSDNERALLALLRSKPRGH